METLKKLLFIIGFISFVISSDAFAISKTAFGSPKDSLSKAIRLARSGNRLTSASIVYQRAASTNFSGGFHGQLNLVKTNCRGLSRAFLFRHIIAMRGNRVAVSTTHDGTLYGMTRDGGRRLEASRVYWIKNVRVSVAIVYKNLKKSSASLGYGGVLQGPGGSCSASYGGTAIRAF